jgi:hypothetical protein
LREAHHPQAQSILLVFGLTDHRACAVDQ